MPIINFINLKRNREKRKRWYEGKGLGGRRGRRGYMVRVGRQTAEKRFKMLSVYCCAAGSRMATIYTVARS